MSNSSKPIQYSINNLVEMKEYPKNFVSEVNDHTNQVEDEEAEGEGRSSFEDGAKEPLLEMEVRPTTITHHHCHES